MALHYGAVEDNRGTRFPQAQVIAIPFGKQKVFLRSLAIQKFLATAAAILSLVIVIVVFTNVSRPQPDSNEAEIPLSANLQAGEATTTTTTTRPDRRQRAPTVRLTQGTLKGTVLQSRAGRNYTAFFTVPYGKPPVGNLRFMPPEPAEGWTGTRDATQKGSMCIQPERYNPETVIVGSEDCLYVHIYTPQLPKRFGGEKPNLAVIAYFFGGGFMHGTANDFGGEYFMDEDIIIVLVESRVGALGFLSTGDLAATGNQGLKDQTLAMSWVKQNIKKFGGDPTRITAFGTSSGSGCSHLHLLSPMNAGIVTRVMSFSGNAISPAMFDMNPRAKAVKLGQALGCPDVENSSNLVACLQNATARDIGLNQPMFVPSVEVVPENGNTSQTFLSESPYTAQRDGHFNQIPWVTGVNSAEAILQSYTLLLDVNQTKNVNDNWNEWITQVFYFKDTPTFEYAQKIRKFYFGDKPVSNETRYNLTNLLSDSMFVYPAVLSTQLRAAHNKDNNGTSFIYWLTKEANVSFAAAVTQYFEPPYGVSHADEVQYFFPRPRYPYIPLDSEWAEFSKFMVKWIVSFANTGAPVVQPSWPPVSEADAGRVFYNLDDETKLVEPINDRIDFWNSLPRDMFFLRTTE